MWARKSSRSSARIWTLTRALTRHGSCEPAGRVESGPHLARESMDVVHTSVDLLEIAFPYAIIMNMLFAAPGAVSYFSMW